jgi:hypothetical protein
VKEQRLSGPNDPGRGTNNTLVALLNGTCSKILLMASLASQISSRIKPKLLKQSKNFGWWSEA